MNKIPIDVPYGVRYISEWGEYVFPKGHVIVDKGVTGCGYTEYCLTNNLNIVLCSPRKMLLESKSRKHKNDLNIRYIENTIIDFQGSKSFEDKVKDHWFNCQGPFGGTPCKILVTYDSCYRVVKALQELGILNQFYFIVDEFQSIFLDSYFKSEVELDFVENLQGCSNVLYLSATPMLEKYLDRLDDFKNLPFYELDWSGTGYTETVFISRKLVSSLITECNEIIQNYKNGNYPVSLDNSGKVVYSQEAVFYFNSISDIVKVIKKNNLTPGEVNILCSKSDETRRKLDKLSRDLEYKPGVDGFIVGQVPLKGEVNKMFTFCTSAVYMGIDLHSDCASTYVFADPNIDCLALDISLDLPQIAGRQRDDENPFKNIINLLYKIKRQGEKKLTLEEFRKSQEIKKRETENILSAYSGLTLEQKQSLLRKLKNDIKTSNYMCDFVGISKTTNQPIYNYLVEISNERAWEVSQKDYQDKISVTRSLSEQGFLLSEYKNENDQIASEFLDNNFYQTGIFREKLKMYCEFCDYYKDNPEVIDIINHRITNPRFRQFYNYFGTKGCSSKNYEEKNLLEAWGNDSKEEMLKKEICLTFKPGDRYSAKNLKQMVGEIYGKLGITKTPKATDLGKYFKLTKTRITLPDKTVVNGFKLESL